MKPVTTRQRFQCDFCKRRSTKSVMEKHEKRCFRNPNRFCDHCENVGHTIETEHNGEEQWQIKVDCPYCSRRDPKIEAEIAKYEAALEKPQQTSESKIPF